mmetsp:Transcript_16539/g.37868  ORF Transcript_16539/g.37868 Transcript_16539/m.37868 type:complete len:253 (+) Transcript_16539:30-788(+)
MLSLSFIFSLPSLLQRLLKFPQHLLLYLEPLLSGPVNRNIAVANTMHQLNRLIVHFLRAARRILAGISVPKGTPLVRVIERQRKELIVNLFTLLFEFFLQIQGLFRQVLSEERKDFAERVHALLNSISQPDPCELLAEVSNCLVDYVLLPRKANIVGDIVESITRQQVRRLVADHLHSARVVWIVKVVAFPCVIHLTGKDARNHLLQYILHLLAVVATIQSKPVHAPSSIYRVTDDGYLVHVLPTKCPNSME